MGVRCVPGRGGVRGLRRTCFQSALRDDPDTGLSAVGAFAYDYANLTGVPTPVQLTAGIVSTDYFRVFGVPPHGDADLRRGRRARRRFVRRGPVEPPFVAHAVSLRREPHRPDDHPRRPAAARWSGSWVRASRNSTAAPTCGCRWSDGSPEMAPGTSQRRYITAARLGGRGRADGTAKFCAAYLGTLSARLAQDRPRALQGLAPGGLIRSPGTSSSAPRRRRRPLPAARRGGLRAAGDLRERRQPPTRARRGAPA